ncbi:MAG TPA: DUF1698 domain-containing protein [Gaiellaceae bacterium]
MPVEPLMSEDLARQLISDPKILWYQRFPLADGVMSPGERDIDLILTRSAIPDDLSGLSVLDIGTTNGGVAFDAERRGAKRVVAIDIHEPTLYGFAQIASAIDSRVEYVRASVYELPGVLKEQFDIVFFLGVLYHLRHPLLAVDALHALARNRVLIETEVSRAGSGTGFYRAGYRGDSSNWFVPSEQCVIDWFASSGFAIETLTGRPGGRRSIGFALDTLVRVVRRLPKRALFNATVLADDPEWKRVSYERSLRVTAT